MPSGTEIPEPASTDSESGIALSSRARGIFRLPRSRVDQATVLLLVAIFLFTGLDKVFHYAGFTNALRDYLLVPRGTAEYLAMPVILVELLIGIGLLLRPWRGAAALAAAITLAVFTIALAANHFLGDRGICGCWFSITLAESTGAHIVQNLVMVTLATMLWSSERGMQLSRTASNPRRIQVDPTCQEQ